MSFFNNNSFFTKHTENSKSLEEEILSETESKEKLIPPADLPNWVTVKGYKAVDKNMESFYGKYKFELNKTHVCEGNLIPCSNGFHFCLSLKDVCALFEPKNGRRYFEVKALVPASHYYDKENSAWKFIPKSCYVLGKELSFSNPYASAYSFQNNSTKYIAKEITFIKEIPFEEIEEYIRLPYLTKENYYNIAHHLDYIQLLIQKWHECADPVFSDLFVDYIFAEKINNISPDKKDKEYVVASRLEKAIEIVNALRYEKISQEFKVAMLLKELSNLT